MSRFTCTNPELISAVNANAVYSGTSPILPAELYGASNRVGRATYGPLEQSVINTRVAAIIGSGPNSLVAPNVVTGSTDGSATYRAYEDKLKAFITSSEAEYCHYYLRYKYWLNEAVKIIKDATSGNLQNLADTQLVKAAEFNTRLIDFTMIMNTLSNTMSQRTGELASQTNDLNSQISANFDNLKAQADILKSEAPAAEIKRRMVDFTKEKAKATNNLLSLYFFLDIVALGMLFYVYKASSA